MEASNKNTVPEFLLNPRFKIYRHLLLQLVILAMTLNMTLDGEAKFTSRISDHLSRAGYYLLVMSVIYFNIYVLVPRYLEKEKYQKYLLGIGLLILFMLAGITTLQAVFYNFRGIKELKETYLIMLNLLSSTLSIGLMIAGTSTLLLIRHWIGYNRRIAELESTTLQSELKHLKRQINPHFLFNMLNNANVLIRKDPEEASRLLFKLEDLLRYQINDSSKEKVSLRSDIHFLNDFLNLEKIRRDKFRYTITCEGDIDKVCLPPLLFIPFVENAVKHNPDSEHESYVHLFFKVRENELTFRCTNSKPAHSACECKNGTGGLGLKNIGRRLELLYPDRHSLKTEYDETCYNVILHLIV